MKTQVTLPYSANLKGGKKLRFFRGCVVFIRAIILHLSFFPHFISHAAYQLCTSKCVSLVHTLEQTVKKVFMRSGVRSLFPRN